MFDEAEQAFLLSGCALIVGSASPEGVPLASRGWGVAELDVVGHRVVVLVDTADHGAERNLVAGAKVAITATAVETLRSLQLKGQVLAVEPGTPDDAKVARRYCDEFFADIEQVDGMHRDVLERMVPGGYARCTVQVEATFDQTPGPKAGALREGQA